MKQRTIKFRCWDREKKEMREVREIHFNQYGGIDVYCSCDDINARAKGEDSLMQYSGMKDKNGVEIYAGDIIREIVDTGNGKEIYDEEVCFIGGAFYPVGIVPSKNLEVIGNIYENTELLKERKL